MVVQIREEIDVINRKLRMILGMGIVATALMLPQVATAESSSVSGYGGNGNAVAGISSSNDPAGPSGTVDSSGTLPFTGLDVSLLAGGGTLLLLIGIGMARMTARPRAESS